MRHVDNERIEQRWRRPNHNLHHKLTGPYPKFQIPQNPINLITGRHRHAPETHCLLITTTSANCSMRDSASIADQIDVKSKPSARLQHTATDFQNPSSTHHYNQCKRQRVDGVSTRTAKTNKVEERQTQFQILQNLINWRNKTHRQPITKIGAKCGMWSVRALLKQRSMKSNPCFKSQYQFPQKLITLPGPPPIP